MQYIVTIKRNGKEQWSEEFNEYYKALGCVFDKMAILTQEGFSIEYTSTGKRIYLSNERIENHPVVHCILSICTKQYDIRLEY